MSRSKRKTLSETKAEYLSYGFGEAVGMLGELIRERFWDAFCKGLPDPNEPELLGLYMKMDKRASELDAEYKRIAWPRIYGEEFDS